MRRAKEERNNLRYNSSMIVIDGHNLIPKVPGLSLRDLDDEQILIDLLQRYIRQGRGAKGGAKSGVSKRIEVFFDRAPVGKAGVRSYGSLVAHFVQQGKTADEAICQFLSGLGKSARNVSVVSSDRQVQANARALHANVLSSEDFARQLAALPAQPDQPAQVNAPLAPLDEWYEIFNIDPAQAERPIEPPRAEKKPVRKSPAKRPHHGFPKKKI